MKLFDSHCHLEDERFGEDRDATYGRMVEAGVSRCICAGSDLDSSERIVALTHRLPGVYGMVGIHPHEASHWTEDTPDRLRAWLEEEKIVGIGEIGLDYYYDLSPREKQQEVFRLQLRLAYQLSVPVAFHIRDAHGDVLDILRSEKGHLPRGVVHCFSGSPEVMREYLRMGYYISFAGPVTFKNANRLLEAAKEVPLNRLLVETDSPYLAPVPMRGKRNEPAFVAHTAAKIAELRGMAPEELARAAFENTCLLYGIPMTEESVQRKENQ